MVNEKTKWEGNEKENLGSDAAIVKTIRRLRWLDRQNGACFAVIAFRQITLIPY